MEFYTLQQRRQVKVKCKKCGKLLLEDTEGDIRYCQGHSILEREAEKETKENG
jgi:ribosomal protein S27E